MEKSPEQDEFNDLEFGVMLSIRYHASRETFFRSWQNAALFIAFMGSTSVVFRLVEISPEFMKWAIIAITPIVLGISLVYRFGEKAELHKDLKVRFTNLLNDMVEGKNAGENNAENLRKMLPKWTRERHVIEADEPEFLQVLSSHFHNDLVRAMGYDKKKESVKINWLQRLFMKYRDIWPQDLDKGQA